MRYLGLIGSPSAGNPIIMSMHALKYCGIGKADAERVFDPFFSTKFTGRGMGLPVALGITNVHRGAIAMQSEPGRGSVFSIFLPVLVE
jgi:signal transduction histidine kinase